MGQSGIPMLNKVGYSMFWNSMWDNKVSYNRMLKEDIFINKFFHHSFNDSLTVNLLNFKKKKIINYKLYNFNTDLKKKSMYKYLFNNSKIEYFSSKLWVFKYQKWVILYNFIYISNIDLIIKKMTENKLKYKNNSIYVYSNFIKTNHKLISSYTNFKSNLNYTNF